MVYPQNISIIIWLQLSKKNKKNDRIKDMLVNVATKDTYVTRATIRNRFIELI